MTEYGKWRSLIDGAGVIPDSVVDSFEDGSLSEYASNSDFGTTTTRAYDGSVSVTSSDKVPSTMWWDSQTVAEGETATVSIRLWEGSQHRAGPILVNGNGEGYLGYYNETAINKVQIYRFPEDSVGSKLAEAPGQSAGSEWVDAVLSFDGVDGFTFEVFAESGESYGSTSVSDTTYSVDRHGFRQFDAVEADLLEKTL